MSRLRGLRELAKKDVRAVSECGLQAFDELPEWFSAATAYYWGEFD
jgi:hypothetical protein